MSTLRALGVSAIAGFALGAAAPARADAKFQDPLDTPAQFYRAADTRPLLAIARAGGALIAVGSRGLIVRSEDAGKSWSQSPAPVQTDLLAVHFPTPTDGWAVGHNGVILRSADAGKTWIKQLDGRIAAESFKKFYATQGTEAAAIATALLDRNYKAGPALPWLDVWFDDADHGFVVGSFGMVAATADGGKTWAPWLDRVDDPRGLNLNAVRGVGGKIFAAGERGMVFALDRKAQHFRPIATGYAGSFFGIVGTGDALLVFGLRGVAYRSANGGASWQPVKLPTEITATAGALQGDQGGFVLVNSAGQLLQSADQGRSFTMARVANPMRYTGIVLIGPRAAVVTGLSGVRTESLPSAAN
jgi:photosystem II stability/assembly factor-like uncharacterized protein